MVVNVTDSAKTQIEKICRDKMKLVRLSIKSGGCQGFQRVWDLEDDSMAEDMVIECGAGFLLIDPDTASMMDGGIIDYEEDLKGSFFTVNFPTMSSRCGCGSSFSI